MRFVGVIGFSCLQATSCRTSGTFRIVHVGVEREIEVLFHIGSDIVGSALEAIV
jgi:hypothetical protein